MTYELYEGDCLEIMPELESESFDMILCDLPYGTTACKWDVMIPFEPLWEEYERIIKDKGIIALTSSQPFTTELISSNKGLFRYELIWDKQFSSQVGVAKLQPMKSHENICIFFKNRGTYNPQMTKGKAYTDIRPPRQRKEGSFFAGGMKGGQRVINKGTRYPKSILTFKKYNSPGQHPTQKPVKLFEYLIKTYTNEGDLVLDNCAGSGTTGVACHNTNRDCILIEQEPEYCQIIRKRMNGLEKPLTSF